jgi:Uncharacterised nucleotidyltransferase
MPLSPYVRIARAAALGQPRELADTLAAIDAGAEAIVGTLGRHTLIRLVLNTLPADEARARLAPALAASLEEWRARHWMPCDTLVRHFERVRDTLDAERVPVLLLKGFYFGHRFYGGLERRPQHDIDLLVPEKDFRRALRALARAGHKRHSYDLHSRTLCHGDCKVDLHRCLRRAPAFSLDAAAPWCSAIDVDLGRLTARTLSDEWTLVFLVLAVFEDLGQGTAKLKQVLDLYLLLRAVDAAFDWDGFFAARDREALGGVSVNVLTVVTTLFEAAGEWPRLAAALDARSRLVDRDSCEGARALAFAGRKDEASLAWFARVYPGSLALYLAQFWYGGFPDNLAQLSWGRVRSGVRLTLGLTRRIEQPARV